MDLAKAGLVVGRMEGRFSLWVLGVVGIGSPSCRTQAPEESQGPVKCKGVCCARCGPALGSW